MTWSPGLTSATPGPHLDDDPGRLVAEHHRQRQRPIAVHDVPIAHAHAGRLDPNANFADARRLLFEIEDLQRRVDLGQNRGAHLAPFQLLRKPGCRNLFVGRRRIAGSGHHRLGDEAGIGADRVLDRLADLAMIACR